MTRYATIDLTAVAPEGKVTVNTVLLWTPAFAVMDASSLNDDADLRGDSTDIPGVDGSRGHPRRRTRTRKDLPLVVVGGVDRTGAVIVAGPAQGLLNNIAYLRANLGIGYQAGDGSVTLSWLQPGGGAPLTEPVIVLGLRRGPTLPGYCCRAVLSLEVLAGIVT